MNSLQRTLCGFAKQWQSICWNAIYTLWRNIQVRVVFGFYRVLELAKLDWGDVRFETSFLYRGIIGYILSILKWQVPGSTQDREGALVTVSPSEVDVIYELSDRMTMNDAQQAAQQSSLEDQSNREDVHSAGSDVIQDDTAPEMTWDPHGLRNSGHWGTLMILATQDLWSNHNVEEPTHLVLAHAIIEDGLSFINRVIELTYQLCETKMTCN